jgi:3-isopropylmalate dehydrogenase
MMLVTQPRQFDVILTENLFGDILSDELSVIGGSIGLLGSASLSADGPALFEPIHGSAPDIAGQDKANPAGAIASAVMMLMHLGHQEAAKLLEEALEEALSDGHRTGDLGGDLGCAGFGAQVRRELEKTLPRKVEAQA